MAMNARDPGDRQGRVGGAEPRPSGVQLLEETDFADIEGSVGIHELLGDGGVSRRVPARP